MAGPEADWQRMIVTAWLQRYLRAGHLAGAIKG
jgi:hypothetical protein